MDDVVGQHCLGERREAADVGEHHGDVELVADRTRHVTVDWVGRTAGAPAVDDAPA